MPTINTQRARTTGLRTERKKGWTLPLGEGRLVLGGAVNFVLSTFRNAISQAHTTPISPTI
ncbi:hypothetical protein ACIBO5_12880 [Nonomuraea angiospora]|uniref:hypothetical protein n=1 Tax=Nonomuraea angiospora TaxID=46172 RepID=UPI0029B72158|nr:hypothetical protein [Nonomuraea angiospora]MDX3107528.1 hypothetical protein [Nonomuraea angiospora]